jgi:hypothetical protein
MYCVTSAASSRRITVFPGAELSRVLTTRSANDQDPPPGIENAPILTGAALVAWQSVASERSPEAEFMRASRTLGDRYIKRRAAGAPEGTREGAEQADVAQSGNAWTVTYPGLAGASAQVDLVQAATMVLPKTASFDPGLQDHVDLADGIIRLKTPRTGDVAKFGSISSRFCLSRSGRRSSVSRRLIRCRWSSSLPPTRTFTACPGR